MNTETGAGELTQPVPGSDPHNSVCLCEATVPGDPPEPKTKQTEPNLCCNNTDTGYHFVFASCACRTNSKALNCSSFRKQEIKNTLKECDQKFPQQSLSKAVFHGKFILIRGKMES